MFKITKFAQLQDFKQISLLVFRILLIQLITLASLQIVCKFPSTITLWKN